MWKGVHQCLLAAHGIICSHTHDAAVGLGIRDDFLQKIAVILGFCNKTTIIKIEGDCVFVVFYFSKALFTQTSRGGACLQSQEQSEREL